MMSVMEGRGREPPRGCLAERFDHRGAKLGDAEAGLARGGDDVGMRGGALACFLRGRLRDHRKFGGLDLVGLGRSEEHTSELQSLMRISYAVFCLKKKKNTQTLVESNKAKKPGR